MDKFIKIGLVGLLIFAGIQSSRQKNTEEMVLGPEQETVRYLSFSGPILQLNGDKHYSILVEEQGNRDNLILFWIADQTALLDSRGEPITWDALQPGTELTAYYPEHTPLALSMPPQLTPELIVVNSREGFGFVQVSVFDDTLTSSDGKLKLNLSVKTVVTDQKGKPVTKLAGRALAVFYTASTKSIPALTQPDKIIVLD